MLYDVVRKVVHHVAALILSNISLARLYLLVFGPTRFSPRADSPVCKGQVVFPGAHAIHVTMFVSVSDPAQPDPLQGRSGARSSYSSGTQSSSGHEAREAAAVAARRGFSLFGKSVWSKTRMVGHRLKWFGFLRLRHIIRFLFSFGMPRHASPLFISSQSGCLPSQHRLSRSRICEDEKGSPSGGQLGLQHESHKPRSPTCHASLPALSEALFFCRCGEVDLWERNGIDSVGIPKCLFFKSHNHLGPSCGPSLSSSCRFRMVPWKWKTTCVKEIRLSMVQVRITSL